MDPAWITALCALAVAVAALLGFCLRWAWRIIRRTQDFLDDYFGQQARPGVQAKPGVMLRLEGVEGILSEISKQMTLNGGTSMHDVVVTTAADVKVVKTDVAALSSRVELFEQQREGRDGIWPK